VAGAEVARAVGGGVGRGGAGGGARRAGRGAARVRGAGDDARGLLEKHLARMRGEAKLLHQIDPGTIAEKGTGFGPALVELSSLDQITEETFGPVLHILRYDPDNIAATGAALHAKGYGLTLGIHSRLESFHAAVKAAMPAGNTYVNRSMIGAVVGVQPFGGEGLSGTGPKAGGPHYLHRFATERVVSVNITAQGGDAELLGLYFADTGQHLESRLLVDHSQPNCRSNVLYKGALQGDPDSKKPDAHTVWVGDVLIRAEATGTDTFEINRNLVLTDGARADSVPNLEIETGEIVGAGHASATGRFDDEQMFYLQARGIPEEQARRLVVRGFFGEIISKIALPEIRDRLTDAIEHELAIIESRTDS
jgi:hypothetical protein